MLYRFEDICVIMQNIFHDILFGRWFVLSLDRLGLKIQLVTRVL